MAEIFHVYASQGKGNYAELGLPASDYTMLDLMERLRLKPGQLPYVEILKFREEYDYLEKYIQELPDIYQLNALARQLDGLDVQGIASFEGLIGMEVQKGTASIPLPRLIDYAYSSDCCHVVEDAVTDYELGGFLVENDFIEEAEGLPDSMLSLLDFGKIGREHREQAGGVYTGFGYVERHSEVNHVSETMDFQPREPAYTILLHIAKMPLAGNTWEQDPIPLRLPAPESQMQEMLEKLGASDWSRVAASVLDSPIPSLNRELYLNGETPQVAELARCLQKLDGQGALTKYKAILEANDCTDLSQMIELAGTVDDCAFEPQVSSPEDVAREELSVILCTQDAEMLLPYIDLHSYGRALLERDHAVITNYGLLEKRPCEQLQDMAQENSSEGMVMM